MTAPLKTFIIYARAYEAFKNQLLRHLRPLRSISVWHDGNILPGEEWDAAIKRELKASELVLFLVSADSLNSDYIQSKELQTALDLLQRGQARLVPIVVAPCAWRFDPIVSGLQALPLFRGEGVKPVRSWPDDDEAWVSVVETLGDMVEEIQKQRELAVRRDHENSLAAEIKAKEETERKERENADHAAFDAIQTVEDLENYLKKFSLHEVEVRQHLEYLKREEEEKRKAMVEFHTRRDHAAFQAATDVDTAAAYDVYLSQFPGGLHGGEAKQRRKKLAQQELSGSNIRHFSVKHIAIAVISSVVLGVFGINYCGKKEEGKPDKSTFQNPITANTAADSSSTGLQSQPDARSGVKPSIKPAYLEPAMASIPSGSFLMGSGEGSKDELPIHAVQVNAFMLAITEVTFEEYDLFCSATGRKKPADEGWGRGNRPVINVSWEDAQTYCVRLSKQTGKRYRLPTEAEWEYAAREGGRKRFGNGKGIADPKDINFDASYAGSYEFFTKGYYRGKTIPVGSLHSPNSFGLHDMSGNVWEWCEDWYHFSYKNAPADGSAWLLPSGFHRVLRGGSWRNYPSFVRAAFRNHDTVGYSDNYVGFRLARTN